MSGANQLMSSARVQVLRVDFNPRVGGFVSHIFSNQAEINTSIIFYDINDSGPSSCFRLDAQNFTLFVFLRRVRKLGYKIRYNLSSAELKVSSFPWLSSQAQRSGAAQTEFTGFFLRVGGLHSQGQRLRLWSRGVTVLREMLLKAAVCWVTVLRKHWPP